MGTGLLPTQSNVEPDLDEVNQNGSEGAMLWPNGQNYKGEPVASSYYGTYHQGGNAFEWMDATGAPDETTAADLLQVMGIGYTGGDLDKIDSYKTHFLDLTTDPTMDHISLGIRITQYVPVPEPATNAVLLGVCAALLSLCLNRRRRARGALKLGFGCLEGFGGLRAPLRHLGYGGHAVTAPIRWARATATNDGFVSHGGRHEALDTV